MSRARIAIVINSLRDGGAERVLEALLSNPGDRREIYDVHLVLLDDEPEARQMPDYVAVHRMRAGRGLLRSVVGLTWRLWRIRPAVVMSFLVRANVSTAIAGRMIGVQSILCERMHLGGHLVGQFRAGPALAFARLLPKIAYRAASLILGVSQGVSENLVEEFKLPRRKVRTINNPYDVALIEAASRAEVPTELPPSYIVSVGRLVAAKNFALLIESYLASQLPDPLVILGEGPERATLERRIAELGASDRVQLPGYVANPFPILRKAVMFVSASRNEGFPNALAEAMALGIPVVATDCRSGPSEILAMQPQGLVREVFEAPYGLLVPEGSVEHLAEAMKRMSQPDVRRLYSKRASARIRDFQADAICEQYWRTIDEAVSRAAPRARRG